MKSLIILLFGLVWSNAVLLSQDLMTENTVAISSRVSVLPNEHNLFVFNGSFICKQTLAKDSSCLVYAFANDFFNYDKGSRFAATYGAGLGYGGKLWKIYLGAGLDYNGKLRGNLGYSQKFRLAKRDYTLCALADVASGDLRYDIKIMRPTYPKPADCFYSLNIGLYAKSNFGYGVCGRYERWPWLQADYGFGYDPEATRNTKTIWWAGVGLSL